MKITILADGVIPDLSPILALGKGLKGRGHAVRLLAGARWTARIEQCGLEAAPGGVDLLALLEAGAYKGPVETGSLQKQLMAFKPLIEQHARRMLDAAWAACQDADLVISSPFSDGYAASIAEKRGIRHAGATLEPAWVATYSGSAAIGAPLPTRVSILNYLVAKRRLEPLRWNLVGAAGNRFRQETLGLPPQTFKQNWEALKRMLVVQGFSTHVIPHPEDWPSTIHTTGYWFLEEDANRRAPAGLMDFLAAGEPPVYVSLRNWGGVDSGQLLRLVLAALKLTGLRAVIDSGAGNLGGEELPAGVLRLDSALPRWIFPCMKAVVHSGDAGMTAEGLRAGVPSVIIPSLPAQELWGSRVGALSVGPPPLRLERLSPDTLAEAIRAAAGDSDIRKCAAMLGAKIRAEDGLGMALNIIEQYLQEK